MQLFPRPAAVAGLAAVGIALFWIVLVAQPRRSWAPATVVARLRPPLGVLVCLVALLLVAGSVQLEPRSASRSPAVGGGIGSHSSGPVPQLPRDLHPNSAGSPALGSQLWLHLIAVESQIEGSAADDPARTAALAAEQEIYLAADRDPLAARTLADAAAASGSVEAITAVDGDLAIVHTWVQHLVAADQAQQQLVKFDWLAPEQVHAIESGARFIWPMLGWISQRFGPTDVAIEPPRLVGGVEYPHFHTGLDVAADPDTPIHVAADGIVLFAGVSVNGKGEVVGYGQYVVVAHADGLETLYGHLQSLAVHTGDVVHQGEIIGREGSTGNSTGPHVHFELRLNGDPLDPLPYLS